MSTDPVAEAMRNFELAEAFVAQYKQMATEARYRPGAPSDGMGNLDNPESPITTEEIFLWASEWVARDASPRPHVGFANFEDMAVLAVAIEGCRSICGGNLPLAAKLLRMAASDLDHRGS